MSLLKIYFNLSVCFQNASGKNRISLCERQQERLLPNVRNQLHNLL